MVQTRRQYRQWVDTRRADYHTDQSETSSQSSQASWGGASYGGNSQTSQDNGPATHASYSPADHCKRHRRPDNEPHNNAVRGYSRRTPRR